MKEDAEEIKEVLSVVSTEIPKLLTAISESMFGGEQTEKYAKAVAEFYSSLREAGMEETQAFELTKQFMDRTNFAAMIQNVLGKAGRHKKVKMDIGEDVEASIKEAVQKEIREKFEEKGEESEEE